MIIVTIYVFGAGNIGIRISQISGNKVIQISSKNLNNIEDNLNIHRIPYGNLHLVKSVQPSDTCIITTRIDLMTHQHKELLFKDLYFLSKHRIRFMHLSSVAVYGSSSNLKTEESLPEPITNYGKVKLFVENELNQMISPSEITHLRVANLFGLKEFNDLTNSAIAKIQSKQPIHLPIMNCQRDFVPIAHFMDFIGKWINETLSCSGPLNFASGNSVSVREWINKISLFFDVSPEIIYDLQETLPLSIVDNRKLKKIWGENPTDQNFHLLDYLKKF